VNSFTSRSIARNIFSAGSHSLSPLDCQDVHRTRQIDERPHDVKLPAGILRLCGVGR
jgi:hypothetical protein